MLLHRLRTMSAEEYERLPDMTEGLENRIAAAAALGGSFAEFILNAKVRRYASSRLQRAAVHALLGITGDDVRAFRAELPRYARVLGFREEARPLLARISREARIPVVTRPGRFRPADDAMERLWALDVRATDVYSLALSQEKDRRSGRDFTQPLIRV
jgi:predicted nucleotidyltransferase